MLRNPLKLLLFIAFAVRVRNKAGSIQISVSLRWNVDLQTDI